MNRVKHFLTRPANKYEKGAMLAWCVGATYYGVEDAIATQKVKSIHKCYDKEKLLSKHRFVSDIPWKYIDKKEFYTLELPANMVVNSAKNIALPFLMIPMGIIWVISDSFNR